MQVIVLRGIPGSGKSHHAKSIPGAKVVSADDHFLNPMGEYKFDPTKIADAHHACLRRFLAELQAPSADLIIVDNTNASIAEMAPYMALAGAFGFPAEIIEITCDPTTAAARNIHGVPAETVQKIHAVMRQNTALIPPWWKRTVLTHSNVNASW
jgi:predicted kinase